MNPKTNEKRSILSPTVSALNLFSLHRKVSTVTMASLIILSLSFLLLYPSLTSQTYRKSERAREYTGRGKENREKCLVFFLKIPSFSGTRFFCLRRGRSLFFSGGAFCPKLRLRAAQERNREDPHHSSESFFASIDCIRARFLHFSHNAVTEQQCLRTNKRAWSSAKTTKSRSRTRRDSCTRLPTGAITKRTGKKKTIKRQRRRRNTRKSAQNCRWIAS